MDIFALRAVLGYDRAIRDFWQGRSMQTAPQISIFKRALRQVTAALAFFASTKFWFLFVLVVSILVTYYDLAALHYTNKSWWQDFHNISSSFLIGGIVSFLFYFVVVYLPERRRRNVIKYNLKKIYAEVKEDILRMIIGASIEGGRRDLDMGWETLDRLKTFDGFRAAFEEGRESNEGFYVCVNILQEGQYHYREIVFNLRILSKQIDFVLHNYLILDENVFDFFKRLAKLSRPSFGYDAYHGRSHAWKPRVSFRPNPQPTPLCEAQRR